MVRERQGQKVALPFYKVSQILYISRLIDGSHIAAMIVDFCKAEKLMISKLIVEYF